VYGTKGCVLIIGGMTMNIIVASLLLRPLSDEKEIKKNTHEKHVSIDGSLYKPSTSNGHSKYSNASLGTLSDDENEYLETCPIYHDVDTQSIYGFDILLHPLTKSDEILWKNLDYKFQPPIKHSISENFIRIPTGSAELTAFDDFYAISTDGKRWFESGSAETVNLGSSLKIFQEEERERMNFRRHSRFSIFDKKSFLGRRASAIKINFMHRRNTVA
jgi:hypothetical protein